MTDNATLERLCASCGTANPPSASFCQSCGRALNNGNSTVFDDLLARGKQALATPSGKNVATGAAIGAVAGVLLPFVSLPLGALVGGAVAYARLRK